VEEQPPPTGFAVLASDLGRSFFNKKRRSCLDNALHLPKINSMLILDLHFFHSKYVLP